ncbi:alpha-2-macroglobulin [Saccharophagus degradans]|uniref:alpha-2-macroglobulin family protein n=1 Tax=Saccharophagus degradans TaxID=86304 RepID=UPI002478175A|nr:alpha-2-macroglobulin [Saccharophagus degradans]WGO97972.1 alpha-2-macroglobulin [Saccharophagus degradans]
MNKWMTVKATLLALVVTCAGCFDSNTDNKQPSNSAGEPANSSLSSPSASESISQSAAAKPKTAAELAKLKQDFAKTPFDVMHITELSYQQAPAIAVTLSAPIDPQASWQNYFELLDKNSSPIKGEWILGEHLNVVYFPFTQPSTQYIVRVNSGLKGLSGRLLASDAEKQLQTQARQQSVKFVSRGSQLAPQLSEGLTVEAVNVKAVDVDFLRLNDDAVGAFLAGGLSNYAYDLQRLKHTTTLAYSARFDLNSSENKTEKTVLPLVAIKPLQEPGVYITVMKEAGDYPYNYNTTWFAVGDISVQARQYPNQLVAFVHSAVKVKPIAQATVTLYDQAGRELAKERADAQGKVSFATAMDKASYLIAQHNKHLSVLTLKGAAMDLSEFSLAARQNFPLEFFMYGPRDIYRPGEEVIVNGLLRDNDGRLLEASNIQARISRPDGRVFQNFVWQGDAQAFYEHRFLLPQQTVTGDWQLAAKLGNGREFTFTFKVEEFLPERMKLALSATANTRFIRDEKLTINVQGDYLYGAPAAGNRAEATLILRQKRKLFDEWQGFVFGAEDYNNFNTDTALDDLTLDNNGSANITLPAEWQGASQPIEISTRVSLFESGGRPVSRTINHTYWPRETLVGVRPLWDTEIASPRTDVQLELINVNTQGKLQAAENLTVVAIRENARYYWQWDDGWQYRQNEANVPVYSRVISLSAEERTQVTIPVEYGNYRLEVRDQQQTLLNSYRFFAGWHWDSPEIGATGRPDKLDLTLNADAIENGQQATLTFNAPYDGLMVFTVEANELMWLESREIQAGDNTLTLPVNNNWDRHDIYATVTLLRSGDSQRKYLPKRAFGLAHLPLHRDNRKLSVSLQAPEKILPASELTTKIKVDNAEGKQVFVTLSAVDTGVLSLTQFKTPNAHKWFFAARGYNVDIRDTWAAFIEQLSARMATRRFGGDADEMARGGEAPQSDVQIVSLYSGKVQLDSNGEADVNLSLPYFNGELRLMAMAWAEGNFGEQEAKVTVAAPLIAEISTPRFLAKGDKANATLDLQNLTDREMHLDVEFSASNILGAKTITQTILLQPKQKQIVQLPLMGTAYYGTGSIVLKATEQSAGGDASVARSWNLSLRPAFPAETVRNESVVNAGEALQFPMQEAARFDGDTLSVMLSMSPTPPFDVQQQLHQLIQYPYGCLEQTTSRAWPLLKTSFAELMKYDLTDDKRVAKNRDQLIEGAIARISGMQRSDGSFGLWSNQSREAHWLTVYATEFLIAAKDQGFNVDDSVLNSAIAKVKKYVTLHSIQWSEREHYSTWPEHYHFSYRAYAAYVMAQRQQVSLGDVRNLFDRYHGSAKTPLPLAQIAAALETLGDKARSEKAWTLAFARDELARGYGGDYASPVRDQAWITALASDSRLVKEPLQLVFTLRDSARLRRWISTQERFALYTLGQKLNQRETHWQASLQVNDAPIAIDQSTPWRGYWKREAVPSALTLTNSDNKPLFTNLTLQGYPVEPNYDIAEGIQVRRFFYNDRGEVISLNNVKTGDLILVRVDMQSIDEYRLPDAMLVELLPAGLELENQNLSSAVAMQDMRVQNKTVAQWMANTPIVHQEFRDDRYVAALSLSRKTASVFYLARAVTPGEYLVPPSLVEDMYRPEIRAVGGKETTLVISPK